MMNSILAAVVLTALGATFETESPIVVSLAPATPSEGAGLRWSPKGARVVLEADGDALVGAFDLGPAGTRPIAVRLERSPGATHYDRLWIDADRDGELAPDERLETTPNESRGKWWSSFSGEVAVPLSTASAAQREGKPAARPYPLSLWFVADPVEPEVPPVLRWSRRGWHEGTVEIGGRPAFVLITEMHMDGVFDQRDAWGLARDRATLYKGASGSLESHQWLDGKAYRPVEIDADGRTLAFVPFDPGFTEEEERLRNDTTAVDRNAPRAAAPLAFSHDLEAALVLAAHESKLVFVDFETTWCGPCAAMNRNVYPAQAVVEAAAGVVAVKVDGDEHRDLVKRFKVGAYPTILLLKPDGTELRRQVGYVGVAGMVEFLRPGA
ncbi:MAG: thioredoxin family protein [Phycisphaerales bacterium]|nr:thioredoxin family protein [Phycisphaerales bacterium]